MQLLLAFIVCCWSWPGVGQETSSPGHLFEVDDAIALLPPGAEEPRLLLEFERGARNGLSLDPAGKRFGFASNHDGTWRVFVADLEGNMRRASADSEPPFSFVLDARWAPRGEWIAFEGMGQEVGTGGVALVHGTTGERREVTPAGEHDSAFAWFPDGQRLAVGYTLSSKVNADHHLISVERRSALEIHLLDGGPRTRVVELEGELDQLTVAPDGEHALYITGGALWHVELKEGAEPKLLQENVGNHVEPAFASQVDGGELRYAFVRRVSREEGKKKDDVPTIAALSGAGFELVFEPRSLVARLLWSPDGSGLALTDFTGVHVLGLDGSEQTLPHGTREIGYMSALDWR